MRTGIQAWCLVLAATLATIPAGAQTRGGEKLRERALGLEIRSRTAVRKDDRANRLVSVIVKFDAPSIASYRGGIAGLSATSPGVGGAKRLRLSSPEAKAYRSFLETKTAALESASRRMIPEARIVNRLHVVVGGVSVVVPEDRVADLYRLPGVAAVYPDARLQPDTARSPQFQGANAIWQKLGGQDEAGEGIIIGHLDTGVWPELDSFSDPDPNGIPYPEPPARWTGTACDFGDTAWNPDDAPFTCNNKLIGAARFMATYDAVEGLEPSEFHSARDDDGHGTHTLSIAGGNAGVRPSVTFDAPLLPPISGMAPRAHVVMYRVCGIEGCFASDSAAAVQQAILDGVDVINFSISGGDNPYSDPASLAFLDAYEAGVFVAAAAGNDGPGANTVSHREPWTTTVAASTSDTYFQGIVTLVGQGGLKLVGVSVTGEVTGPVVLASAFAPAGNPFCLTPFPAGTWTNGEIVVCARGTNARVEKGQNVLAGGAAGMILYNPTPADIDHDKHYLPAIHIDAPAGDRLLRYLRKQSAPPIGTISQGLLKKVARHPGGPPSIYPATAGGADVMAEFSSRGGPAQTLGITKPDVTATGVNILAGGTPDTNDSGEASSFGAPGEYMFISGTSMSSPHVAGAAALLMDLHPDWSPWRIKSALMLTAKNEGVTKEDGVTPADPFDYGSGRIDLKRAGSPGLTLVEPTRSDFLGLAGQLWNLNYPSLYIPAHPGTTTVQRTFRSEAKHPNLWWASVSSPADVQVEVEPTFLFVDTGDERTIEIRVDSRDVPEGQVRHATLHLSDFSQRLDFPITIVKDQGLVALTKSCEPASLDLGDETECTVTVTNTAFEDVAVSVRDRVPEQLEVVSVTGASGTDVLTFSGNLGAADPPVVNAEVDPLASPFGYVGLGGFGGNLNVGAGDETIANVVGIPPFRYAGRNWDTIGVVSNGYLVVGGGNADDVTVINTDFPDPERPNNVLAPCWTDLNPAAGGRVLVNVLTDGADTWTVVEWERVPNFTDGARNTCQIWIGSNSDANPEEDISFTYGPDITTGDLGFMTVGAENEFGNRGQAVYFDGNGTPPAPSFPVGNYEVDVFSTPGAPGESHVIRFTATGASPGAWKNCAEMENSATFGTVVACAEGEVLEP